MRRHRAPAAGRSTAHRSRPCCRRTGAPRGRGTPRSHGAPRAGHGWLGSIGRGPRRAPVRGPAREAWRAIRMPRARVAALGRLWAMARQETATLRAGEVEVTITNPSKVFFPGIGLTKRDLVEYYLAVADGAIRGVRDRPMALKRFVEGIDGEFFFQKRAPKSVPDFVSTVELSFPSGRTADEVVVSNPRALAWVINLGCVDLNPHPVRADDLV